MFSPIRRLSTVIVIIMGVLSLQHLAWQQVPSSGSLIVNQAEVSYIDPTTSQTVSFRSEAVSVTVSGVESFKLIEDRNILSEGGVTVELPHKLINDGSLPVKVTLIYENLANDDYDLGNLKLYVVTNGSGIVRSGGVNGVYIPSGGTITLSVNQVIDLVLTGLVPSEKPGDIARVKITAHNPSMSIIQINTDTITIRPPELFRITKTAEVISARPGDELAYTIVVTPNTLADTRFNINIDGINQQAVIVRDLLPANTRLSRIQSNSVATALYHVEGTPIHNYVSMPPADLNMVDAIAWRIDSIIKDKPVSLVFYARASTNANGNIVNTAKIYFNDGLNPAPSVVNSAPAIVQVSGHSPIIEFHRNSAFDGVVTSTLLGAPLYIQANAAACNLLPDVVESNLVVITSARTGDRESYTAIESAPNSGIFRILNIPVQNANVHGVSVGDGIIQTVRGDELIAEMAGCGVAKTSTTILISTAGIVFDSANNLPIAGARVSIYNQETGELALVYQSDGKTPAPATVITGADGAYEFPALPPGLYRIVVEPPPGYSAPSKVQITALAPNRVIDPSASYLKPFRVIVPLSPVSFDIPLDPITAPATGAGLFIQKAASRAFVEAGEFVDYSVRVKNVSGGNITDVSVTDQLPYGFLYIGGSARLNGNPLPEPQISGSRLVFAVGEVRDQQVVTLTYRLKVTPEALKGNGVNRAVATGGGFLSNEASAMVKVQPGVFTDRGIIIGKVYVDINENRIQDPGEMGVPGVRLFMEDGTYAITDSEGKYNFYGVTPKTHIVKVDLTTLPQGARLLTISTRNALSPSTLFVDLKNGELHKADFAISGKPESVLEAVKERKAALEKSDGEIDSAVINPISADGSVVLPGDIKAQPASGIKSGSTNAVPSLTGDMAVSSVAIPRQQKQDEQSSKPYKNVLPEGTLSSQNSQLPSRPQGVFQAEPLDNVISNLNNTLDFIGLKDGDVLLSPQINVRIKGVLGSRFELELNGTKIQENRVGKRVRYAPATIEAWEYIGVNFKPGTNTLILRQFDPFGNQRGEKSIKLVAPDKLGDIRIILPADARADDKPAVIKVELTDAHGLLVTARTPLTLETSLGRWDVEDLDKTQPGVQTFIEGGRAEFKLLPPIEPGEAKIAISSGILKSEESLAFLPKLRPMMAVGIIEGTINISKVGFNVISPARSRDGFEQELRNFSFQGRDGKIYGGGRTAFYLKGKIKGEYLLTAAYDSDKDTKERMFRDIQPDEYYPVYGDSSIKGFDAQSTGRLYVRIDNKKSYLLYGDFNTQSKNVEVRSLGNYNRSLTGIIEHYEKKNVVVNAWASYDSTRQVVEEVRANGTSGPYFVNIRDGVVNSEKVEILTRDRYQPSFILKVEPMVRFTDYEFEPFTGRILFRRPIPSLDSNLNPISIRVTYEVDDGGEKFWVYGADAQVKLNERLEVGGSAVRDENPLDKYELYSANATLKLGKNTFLIGEVARSNDEIIGSGNAGRIELRHRSEKTEARIYYGRTETTFSNSAAMLMPGRVEGGAKITHKLTPTMRLILQGILSEDVETGGSRKGIMVGVEKSLSTNVRLEVGGRYTTETTTPASESMYGATPNEVRSLRTRLTVPFPFVTNATMYGEYENDIVETDNRMVAFGMDAQLKNKSRFYARHEFINSLGSQFELNSLQSQHSTVVGLETDYMKNGQMFNEYRAKDAFSGREAEAAIGLRNQWTLYEGLRLNTTFERVNPITGSYENESTAIAGALEYTGSPDWKGTTRLELRTSTQNDSVLHTMGYARKLNQDWTFLGRTIVYHTENKGFSGGDRTQARLQLGMAWRQTQINKWNAIGKYEFKHEDDSTQPAAELNRNVHIFSVNANYQPVDEWIFSLRYASKFAFEDSCGISSFYHAHMMNGRIIHEITRVVDVGLNSSLMVSGDDGSLVYGIGPEVGITIKRNLRLGFGFNFFGFHDRDLSGDVNTDPGFYVNLRLKFDETFFSKENKQ